MAESVLGADGVGSGGESNKILSSSCMKNPGGGGWVISCGGTGAWGHSIATVCTSGSGLGEAQAVSDAAKISSTVSSRVDELDPGRRDCGLLEALYLVGTLGCLHLCSEALAGHFGLYREQFPGTGLLGGSEPLGVPLGPLFAADPVGPDPAA